MVTRIMATEKMMLEMYGGIVFIKYSPFNQIDLYLHRAIFALWQHKGRNRAHTRSLKQLAGRACNEYYLSFYRMKTV